MTNIFDNAKSIFIGNKEVKSLEIDSGMIYEKEEEYNPTINIAFCSGFEELFLEKNGGVLSDYCLCFLSEGNEVLDSVNFEEGNTDIAFLTYAYYWESSDHTAHDYMLKCSVRKKSDLTKNVVSVTLNLSETQGTVYGYADKSSQNSNYWSAYIRGASC